MFYERFDLSYLLIGAVLVGVNFAKGLSYAAGKPLVPVHHLRGHIAANYLTHQSLHPPFLCLVASGGHSHIVMVEDWCRYKVLGRTVDDAAGEAYDKVARTLGLPYPGGPSVAAAARDGDPHAYKLPVPHVEGKYNVSFSGLKTAVINEVHNAEQKGQAVNVADMAASFQERIDQILAKKLLLQGGSVTLTLGSKNVQFLFADGAVLLGNAVDGTYPNWRSVIPATTERVTISVDRLANSLAMIAATSDDNEKQTAMKCKVEMAFTKATTTLRRGDTGLCELESTSSTDAPAELAFNIAYLSDAVSMIRVMSADASIGYSASASAITMRPKDKDYPLAVVMPLRA